MGNPSQWSAEEAVKHLVPYLDTLPSDDASDPARFLHILHRLKSTERTGWVNMGIRSPESISDHMYRMAIISFMAPPPLSRDRCIQIALVHDIAESIVGDITPLDPIGKDEKRRREESALNYLVKLLHPVDPTAAQLIHDSWIEYEYCTTPEARFVKDVDKYELLVQAVEYERQHEGSIDLEEFTSVRKAIKTDFVAKLADQILNERKLLWESLNKKSS